MTFKWTRFNPERCPNTILLCTYIMYRTVPCVYCIQIVIEFACGHVGGVARAGSRSRLCSFRAGHKREIWECSLGPALLSQKQVRLEVPPKQASQHVEDGDSWPPRAPCLLGFQRRPVRLYNNFLQSWEGGAAVPPPPGPLSRAARLGPVLGCDLRARPSGRSRSHRHSPGPLLGAGAGGRCIVTSCNLRPRHRASVIFLQIQM